MADTTPEVVTPAADAPAVGTEQPTQTPEGTAPSVDESKPVDPPKLLSLTQEDLDRIVKSEKAKAFRKAERIVRAETRAEIAERQLQEVRQSPHDTQRDPNEAPKASDFKDYEDYLVEKAKFVLRKEGEQAKRQAVEQETNRTEAEKRQRVGSKLSAAIEEIPDFEAVVLRDGNLPITQHMVDFMEESDLGTKVLYELAKKPDELRRIASLPKSRQFIELDALEKKLSAPPKPSNAPKPITPSGSGDSGVIDPEKLSADEWRAWRDKQIRQRKK